MPADSTGWPAMQGEGGRPEARLYRLVAERIELLIRQEGLATGARLPAERELAASLGVSRASLREAFVALEIGGVIEVRSGSGVYVAGRPALPAAGVESGPGPFEVLAARRVVEAEVAARAARNSSDSALDAILAALLEMEQTYADPACHEMADRRFHLALARAAGNSALVALVEYLWNQRGAMAHRLKHHYRTEELGKATLADHRAIFSAVAARDEAGARQAMRAHLARVHRTLSGG
ncbi:GntR family transcriptional regulator [Duganella sp. Root336D2]|nr:GntR family transcriptional regulator [Duganella sp. Root336D2]